MKADGLRRFFKYARDRHQIYLNRRARPDGGPWTKDPILRDFRFCNVYRELDKTTAWFRKHVREVWRDKPEVLLATVVFRMLNRIPSGEGMFCQMDIEGTAFFRFLETKDCRHLKRGILEMVGPKGPYVTGAYIISSPPGYTKLEGIMQVLEHFHRHSGWREQAIKMLERPVTSTLESTYDWCSQQEWLGKFHSYEIVTDLRHTALLENASDINTWASPGPGARRGLNRIQGRDVKDKSLKRGQLIEEMREVLQESRMAKYWPVNGGEGRALFNTGTKRGLNVLDLADWPAWEMREVEHTLCEFDKYRRVELGEGRPRGVFP